MTDTAHDRVTRMVRLSAAPEAVWREIGGFGGIAEWHPHFVASELSEIDGETYRRLTTAEGEQFFERLAEAGPLRYRYEMIEGALPAADFTATLACVAEPGGCHVFWSARFEPEGEAHRADEIVGALFEIGLRALEERFG